MTKNKTNEIENLSISTTFECANGHCGLVASDGTLMVPAQYKNILYWKDAIFSKYPVAVQGDDNLWGVVVPDGKGTVISECQWKDIELLFISDHFVVQSNITEKWGVINGQGEVVVPVEMDMIINDCSDSA